MKQGTRGGGVKQGTGGVKQEIREWGGGKAMGGGVGEGRAFTEST